MDNYDSEGLHVKKPEQNALVESFLEDMALVILAPSPAATPKAPTLLPQLQNTLKDSRLIDNVTIAAQQFHALKAAGVDVPDIFDKNYQDFEGDNKDSSDELLFNNDFLDEDESHRQPKDKHPKMRSNG